MKVLSKSRFKIGLECPNKLYYTSNKQYGNSKNEDSFLQALAQGGFQVEELARLHYPGGIFINTEPNEYDKAIALTQKALLQENVVIYEAAFLFNTLYVRTDILVKKGNQITIIEVKAKSFNPNEENVFLKNNKISSEWKPYLFDLAFQKYVVQNVLPDYSVKAKLMMADKSKKATVDGLNQMFRIPKNGNPRTDIITKVTSLNQLGESVLSTDNNGIVDTICNDIISGVHPYKANLNFSNAVALLDNIYQKGVFPNSPTDFSKCKGCEFKLSKEQEAQGLLSGFKHCFKTLHQWSDAHFDKPNALQIWNYRGKDLINENRLLMEQLTQNDFTINKSEGKMSTGERQWTQVEKARTNDETPFVMKEELKEEMANWKFPLHFIDFETSAVALPFTAGRHPYEQVAFQFSHHQYNEDGSIEHKSEFISNTPGEFPNFKFVRALQQALGNDEGTIFRFAAHENSIINAIINQLNASTESDKNELITFLQTITVATKNNALQWEGERAMVDLNKVVKDYYYNPYTKGSNSIKAVLPAALHSSNFLKAKYAKSLNENGVSSKNFPSDFVWLQFDSNGVINPYKMLPSLFENLEEEDKEHFISEMEDIADGGAALTAYAKLQYQNMTAEERNEITKGLLKYCELDTLAMVMIYEHFKHDLIV